MKFVTFASAPAGQDCKAFQDWFIAEHLPRVKAAPTFRGGVVRRRIDPPDAAYATPIGDMTGGIAHSDVIMELWMSSNEDFRREILPHEKHLRERGAMHASYIVTPRLQKDGRITEAGKAGRRPEVTYIISLKWKPTVSVDFAMSEYDEHAAIALRIQTAMTKYEQNFVREAISWTPELPLIDCYSDFSFRTAADFRDNYRVTEEELQDTTTFVAGFHAAFFGDAEAIGA